MKLSVPAKFVIICGLTSLTWALNSPDNCGLRAKSFDSTLSRHNSRIVGGKKAPPGAWPWMASVLHSEIPGVRFCGAALINEQWILTVAHCFKITSFKDTEWQIEFENELKLGVEKIVRNDRFTDTNGVYNDIALVKLNQTVHFDLTNYTLNSICLSDYHLLDTNALTTCFALGYGSEALDGSSTDYLKEVKLPIVDSDTCFAKHQFNFDASTQICAGGLPHGGSGTCFGDSGGPLVCKHLDRWYLLGVTSYGRRCASLPGVADVFTKIPAYQNWIQESIKKN